MAGIDIRKEVLALPKGWEGKLAFVLYNVFTEEECQYFIDQSESRGYEAALLNMGSGKQASRPDIRNSSRCIWDTDEESAKIWRRIESFIPGVWANRKVVGLNERLRILRYDPGEYFLPHLDGSYVRDNGETSYITIQLYLNEGFEGGSTTFLSFDKKERCEVVPKTGLVLVFQHDILHEGSALIKGRKYTIRTDVMYTCDDTKRNKKGFFSSLFSRDDN